MQNFEYCTPTRLIFGKDSIEKLPSLLAPYGRRVLFTYGGGSIKKIGLYDKVRSLLKGFEVYEYGGIEPNPKYSTNVLGGVKLCKEKKIDVVLAVGGGSILDCSKIICAGAAYEGEPWDLITHRAEVKGALPLVDILTLAATGSEYDSGGVISRPETNDKICLMSKFLYPVASILDPTYTFSVSRRQTAAGVTDGISHVLEQYFCADPHDLTDGMCEAAIRSLMKSGKIALREPSNYEARGEIMLCCALACNRIFAIGTSDGGWPCHGIEHALSGYYDITHGEGLAIVTPVWMRHILNKSTVKRFVSYGVNVFRISPALSECEIADRAICMTKAFFTSIGMPQTLRDVGIDGSRLAEMAHHIALNEGLDHAWAPLSEEEILSILTDAL